MLHVHLTSNFVDREEYFTYEREKKQFRRGRAQTNGGKKSKKGAKVLKGYKTKHVFHIDFIAYN